MFEILCSPQGANVTNSPTEAFTAFEAWEEMDSPCSTEAKHSDQIVFTTAKPY